MCYLGMEGCGMGGGSDHMFMNRWVWCGWR